MSDAGRRPTLLLEDLEGYIAAVERLSYADVRQFDFFSDLVQGLCSRLSFVSLRISLFHTDGEIVLGARNSTELNQFPAPDFARQQPGESRSDRHSVSSHGMQLVIDHCFLREEILRIEALTNSQFELDPAALHELLGTCAVLAGNFLIRSTGRILQSQLSDRVRIERMVAQLGEAESGPQPETDLCRVVQSTLGVDRVSLLWTTSHHARLIGSSSSTAIDRNSQGIRLLEGLAAEVEHPDGVSQQIMGDGCPAVAPEIESRLTAYIEETGVRRLHWLPIARDTSRPASLIGFLLLEHFSGNWPDESQQNLFALAETQMKPAARRTLLNVNESMLSRLRILLADRKRRNLAWLGGLALLAFLLLAIRKDLEISVDGTLHPDQRITIFAPMQGIIEQVPVQHGSDVAKDEILFILRAPDLEIEDRRISGEMATLRSRLDSLKSARIRSRSSGSRSGTEADLSAEESDLEAQLKGLTAQLALVRERMQQLIIKTPMAGQVDRWDLNQALANRPVSHGQYLCDVLGVAGKWVVELEIPDEVAGYVLQAQQESPCRVTYLLRNNAGRKFVSQINQLSNSAQLNRKNAPVVMAEMPAGMIPEADLRVGAGVLARIHCGRRSIGFIYLREVLEFIQRTFWI